MKIIAMSAGAAALCLSPLSALATPHVSVTGVHQTVAVTGYDFPAGGAKFQWQTARVESGGHFVQDDNIQTVTPTQHAQAQPPCLVACKRGQFYSTVTLTTDPCTGAPGTSLKMLVQVWKESDPRNIMITKYFTVQCPTGAQAPTAAATTKPHHRRH